MLNVCVVTHRPRPAILQLVLAALGVQTLSPEHFRVRIVDNASEPPLEDSLLDDLRSRSIECELIREKNLGVVHGRIRAIRQSGFEPIVFVDDDNELDPHYLSECQKLLQEHPDVGCFGGKMLVPPSLAVPDWAGPLLYTLGTRDCGEEAVVDWLNREWQPWHPTATAGLLVRPEVTTDFLERYATDPGIARLGRKGAQLMSHEDYLLVHGAKGLGYKVSYQPALLLYHHFSPHRLTAKYLVRLMFGYGRSGERLAETLHEPVGRLGLSEIKDVLRPWGFRTTALQVRACHSAYYFGIALERARRKLRPALAGDQSLPRVAIVGGESLSGTHGTGWVMSRQLQTYPRELILDLHFQQQGESLFRELALPIKFLGPVNSFQFELRSMTERKLRSAREPFRNFPGAESYQFCPLPSNFKAYGGVPQIIYSTVFSNLSLNFLDFVHRRMPYRIPVLQHFLDFQPEDEATFVSLWRRIQPWVREVWALSPRLAKRLENLLQCQVRVVSCLHQPLTDTFKKNYAELNPEFRAVMIGNLWQRNLLPHLESLWKAARHFPDLSLEAIKWYGSPRRFVELAVDPMDLTEIVDGGLLATEHLCSTLVGAELAILPFSSNAANHYSRYSLPSRLSDYCAAGLPVFALASPGSQVWEYVHHHGIGRCACPSNLQQAAETLRDFLKDRDARQAAGRKARKLAEEQMDLAKHQRFLQSELERLARW